MRRGGVDRQAFAGVGTRFFACGLRMTGVAGTRRPPLSRASGEGTGVRAFFGIGAGGGRIR
ncbi:MAG: hypothetical protein AVDCRST_MAG59-3207 [uncultured Thermomicrobiales bacterium]|uniref:Uncharacterized protein n=1 Tax=uncultured Thermomicrobiales bacterium TaxID=1645740 RepID=A0A6J4V7V8_9BACT|nr:MAG: hypothetical protein AVDCRST_MAG59-3207 [uncultured Thermomicrobiales bacterium]